MEKTKMKKTFGLFLLFVLLTHSAALARSDYDQNTTDVKFNHLTVENGLSHHEVSFVLQDAQGFMWFGTKYGLNKYDGTKMMSFNHDPENSNSLTGDFVWWIQEGKDDTLWIATWERGISRLNLKTGLFTNYQHDENNPKSLGVIWSGLFMKIEKAEYGPRPNPEA